jgi:hypothetical protein
MVIFSRTITLWQAALIFLGILAITAVVLPWKLAFYDECERRGGWTKGLLLAVVTLVSIVTLFYSWTNWWGARKLSAALAMLREKNEPTRFEDLVPPPGPDADNVAAAPVFQELFASEKDSRLKKLKWPGSSNGLKRESGESEIHRLARTIDSAFQGDDQAAGKLVLKHLDSFAPLIEEVVQAVRRPSVSWPLDYSKGFEMPSPHITAILSVSQVLSRRALAELAVGAPDKAFEDVQTILGLARVVGSSPLLISLLVQNSNLSMTWPVIGDGLERHAWTDDQLAALSSELSRIDLMARFSDALRGERALLFQIDLKRLSEVLFVQSFDAGKLKNPTALRAAATLWPAGWLNEDKAEYIGTIQRYIDAVNNPKELPTTLADIEAALSGSSAWNKIRNPLSYRTMPAILGVAKKIAFTQTILRSLAPACAVERYRMAHGRLPATLEDLVPAFLASIPTDPLTGKPLCYKPSESSSYLIYGTGWDQTDNAGSGLTSLTSLSTKTMNQPDWGVLVKF